MGDVHTFIISGLARGEPIKSLDLYLNISCTTMFAQISLNSSGGARNLTQPFRPGRFLQLPDPNMALNGGPIPINIQIQSTASTMPPLFYQSTFRQNDQMLGHLYSPFNVTFLAKPSWDEDIYTLRAIATPKPGVQEALFGVLFGGITPETGTMLQFYHLLVKYAIAGRERTKPIMKVGSCTYEPALRRENGMLVIPQTAGSVMCFRVKVDGNPLAESFVVETDETGRRNRGLPPPYTFDHYKANRLNAYYLPRATSGETRYYTAVMKGFNNRVLDTQRVRIDVI